MPTEYVEIRPQMAEWLNTIAEPRGVTLQELVTHILLLYVEEWEDSDEDQEEDEDEDEKPESKG